MKIILSILSASLILSGASVCRGGVMNGWINEFHYENKKADIGEFVEVVLPTSVSVADRANVTLTLYDGNGSVYNPGSGSAHALSTFAVGPSVNGFQVFSKLIPAIHDGPDGFALSYSGTLVQFLSYEGSFAGAEGVANGQSSINIGVSEIASAAAGGSLGLIGTGSSYSDFSWTTFSDDTPGLKNGAGQTFTAVPEPVTWALIVFGTLFGAVQLVRLYRRHPAAAC